MSSSIKDQIINKIVLKLQEITIANGYNQDVGIVTSSYLEDPEATPDDKFPALYVVDDGEIKDYADIGSIDDMLTIIIVGYVKKENDQENINEKRRKLENDIEKAIFTNWQWDGLAIDTLIQKIVTDRGIFKNFSETNITVIIRFYHDRGEPDSQANSPIP